MTDAWVVRPKPHGIDRLEQFIEHDIVAIGWPGVGDLTGVSKSDIRARIEANYDGSAHKLGQAVGQVDRFVNKIATDDYVLVPTGGDVYIGMVKSGYSWRPEDAGDCVAEFVDSEPHVSEHDRFSELQQEYLDRLQDGDIPGINSNSFEGAVVATVLDNYFPSINRQATSSDDSGDTDLMAELPGDVTVRVQVKHFYMDRGELGSEAVEQLSRSMSEGDNGIVVTSTTVGEAAREAADEADHQIGIIDGEEFVELLFEDLQNYTDDELASLGLASRRVIRQA